MLYPVVPDSLIGAVSRRLDRLAEDADGPIGIAVSGGSDSLALLYLVENWARMRARDCLVLSVDHGLRPEAAEEAAFVAEKAKSLGLSHKTLHWHPKQKKVSQAIARRARHRLLANALREAGGHILLTGHTADDQRETFLLRARAGSGWYGLAGMQSIAVSPIWPEGHDIFVARPLLSVSRAHLRAFLSERHIGWCEDPSNQNPDFERVRARALLSKAPQLGAKIAAIQRDLIRLRTLENARISAWMAASIEARIDGVIAVKASQWPAKETLARALGPLLMFAGGHDRPARLSARQKLAAALISDTLGGGATLGGARLARRGRDILIGRDPGRMAPLGTDDQSIWDGRFVLDSDLPAPTSPVEIHPLARPGLTRQTLNNRRAYCLIPDRLANHLRAHRQDKLYFET